MIDAMNWARGALTLLAVGSLVACGGTKANTRSEGPPAGGRSATNAATPRATGTTPGKKKLSDDEFKVREVKVVQAPTYLKGIKKEAQDTFRHGVLAVTSSPADYKGGAGYFRKAIEQDPGFLEAYFNLGMSLERMGKRDQALQTYEQAVKANPDSATASAYIAKIYLGKARGAKLVGDERQREQWLTKAKSLLDPLLQKAPDDVAVNNAMALYFLSVGDLNAAERYVKEVLFVEPRDVTGLNTRGLIYLKRGRLHIAEWIFKNKVLKEDKNSTEAMTNLGYTYIQLGQRPLAMRFFKDALALDPSNMDVRMDIAAMLLEHLNYAEAHEHYRQVLAAEPLNKEAKEGLCDSEYGMAGAAEDPKAQFETAIQCYLEFLKAKPERTDLYKRIAETYQNKIQSLENAVKFFDIYLAKAKPKPEEVKKVQGVVKVLKDIIAHGGLKAMNNPEPMPEDGADGGQGDSGSDAGDGAGDGADSAKPEGAKPHGADSGDAPAEGDGLAPTPKSPQEAASSEGTAAKPQAKPKAKTGAADGGDPPPTTDTAVPSAGDK